LPPASDIPQNLPQHYEAVHQIASADIHQLSDTDSRTFIAELTEKSGQIAFVNWLGVFPLLVFLASFGSKERITQQGADSVFVRVTSSDGVNIREKASAKSGIVKAATYAQVFHCWILRTGNGLKSALMIPSVISTSVSLILNTSIKGSCHHP
jgi:hypothetical protein